MRIVYGGYQIVAVCNDSGWWSTMIVHCTLLLPISAVMVLHRILSLRTATIMMLHHQTSAVTIMVLHHTLSSST